MNLIDYLITIIIYLLGFSIAYIFHNIVLVYFIGTVTGIYTLYVLAIKSDWDEEVIN